MPVRVALISKNPELIDIAIGLRMEEAASRVFDGI
jgi:hypothetical protein